MNRQEQLAKTCKDLILMGSLALPLFYQSCQNTSGSDVSLTIDTTANSELAKAAVSIINDDIVYDPSYYVISYPNGDVSSDIGVCSDVVIRTYREVGIDLQKLVHEDMVQHFDQYPTKWGLTKPDKNIDHRRVPNLMTFFTRMGASLTITKDPQDYLPGDVVCWTLGGGTTHTGMVSNIKSKRHSGYQIVHNIGSGQELDDCLFDYQIIGHYRY